MKRRITLSIALALSVLVSLTISDSTAKAEPPQRFRAQTGIVPLGRGQQLRVAIVDYIDEDDVGVTFRRTEYTQSVCSGGFCRLAVTSETTSDPIMLMRGEAASIVVNPTNRDNIYVSAVVLSNSRKAKVTAMVVDTSTQKVVAFANTTFDDQAVQ